jgi:hypothetical protein
MSEVASITETSFNGNIEIEPRLLNIRRLEFENRLSATRSRASLDKLGVGEKIIAGRGELSNLMEHKFYFALAMENALSICIFFTSYFAFVYESDHTSNEDVFYFLSALVSCLTMMYVVVRLFLFRLHKLHLLSKSRYFNNSSFRRELLLGSIAVAVYLIHPNMLFFRKQWIVEHCFTYSSPYFYYFRRNFNEYLFIFQFHVHIWKIIKNYLSSTVYAKDSTERISDMFGFNRNYVYIIKCLIKENNMMYFVILLAVIIFYMGVLLRIVEYPVYPTGSSIGDLFTASWLSSVVVFTIGYGDIFPYTYFGRIIVIEVCFLSAIVLSFVTSQFLALFKLNDAEQASQSLQSNISLRQRMQAAASALMIYSYRSIQRVSHQPKIFRSFLNFKLDGAKRNFKQSVRQYKNEGGGQGVDVAKELMKVDTIIDGMSYLQM